VSAWPDDEAAVVISSTTLVSVGVLSGPRFSMTVGGSTFSSDSWSVSSLCVIGSPTSNGMNSSASASPRSLGLA